MEKKKLIAGIIALIVGAIASIVLGIASSASADKPPVCTEVVTVVDEEAYTEEIVHPEVTETVHHEAVTETVPGVWANWSPRDTKGPQDYVPIWPTDERGVWIVHEQGVPPGHAGPDGVYQQGAGNSPWFYRQAEQVIVVEEAYDETVVVEEEWTETVDHPEVSHEETVTVDCPDEPENPEPPVVTPDPPVDEPDNPADPKEPKDPVITTQTVNKPFKTVKISTHKSGEITRDVTRYPKDAVEEGL